MRARRGVAMIAALWLVVAIAVVALQFSLDARQRRVLGINAAERGTARGLDQGALSMMQARLQTALQSYLGTNSALAGARAGDPWMDADSVFSGPVTVDSVQVNVHVIDLGARLNINNLTEDQLRTFFGFVLGDYAKADQLAETISDWLDVDDLARTNGDEKDGYVKRGLLALPANAPFQNVDELLKVEGMTPDIYIRVAADFTTYGNGTVNVNTAPVEVLRALPGMTDQILANILNQRSRGLRIASISQVIPGVSGTRGGRGAAGQAALAQVQLTELARSLKVDTDQLELDIIARSGAQARPVKLTAMIQRTGQNSSLTWEQW